MFRPLNYTNSKYFFFLNISHMFAVVLQGSSTERSQQQQGKAVRNMWPCGCNKKKHTHSHEHNCCFFFSYRFIASRKKWTADSSSKWLTSAGVEKWGGGRNKPHAPSLEDKTRTSDSEETMTFMLLSLMVQCVDVVYEVRGNPWVVRHCVLNHSLWLPSVL